MGDKGKKQHEELLNLPEFGNLTYRGASCGPGAEDNVLLFPLLLV